MRNLENYSDYARTGNNAIDLVAQAVGWANKNRKPIVSVTLNRLNYAKYWAGTEILMKRPLPEQHLLTFEGVPILQGSKGQFEALTIQYTTDLKVKPMSLS